MSGFDAKMDFCISTWCAPFFFSLFFSFELKKWSWANEFDIIQHAHNSHQHTHRRVCSTPFKSISLFSPLYVLRSHHFSLRLPHNGSLAISCHSFEHLIFANGSWRQPDTDPSLFMRAGLDERCPWATGIITQSAGLSLASLCWQRQETKAFFARLGPTWSFAFFHYRMDSLQSSRREREWASAQPSSGGRLFVYLVGKA